jgi:hypothetical protein
VSHAWFVGPAIRGKTASRFFEDVLPPDAGPSTTPSPDQVFAVLGMFPEYRVARIGNWVSERTGDRSVQIELRRPDGSYAIDVNLLKVVADDQPVGVFTFSYYREVEELLPIVSKLADACGPQVLRHESGGEPTILVRPGQLTEPDHLVPIHPGSWAGEYERLYH